MLLAADELGRILRAHGFLDVQRPPQLGDLETEGLEQFVRLLGELIAAGLARNGLQLAALQLGVANIDVEPGASGSLPGGSHVGVSISGTGDWPDGTWSPSNPAELLNADVTGALAAAGAAYAYTRRLGDDAGSVTALFRRARPATRAPTPAP